jgi:hypothetical protein
VRGTATYRYRETSATDPFRPTTATSLASVAHPNPSLLDEPEARLVINASGTLLHYLDDKLS